MGGPFKAEPTERRGAIQFDYGDGVWVRIRADDGALSARRLNQVPENMRDIVTLRIQEAMNGLGFYPKFESLENELWKWLAVTPT